MIPSAAVTGICPDCREPVIWALTVNRKRLALDPEPHPDGNQAAYRNHTETWLTRQLRRGEEPLGYERRFMPHIATCAKREPKPRAALALVGLPSNVIPFRRTTRRPHNRKPPPGRKP